MAQDRAVGAAQVHEGPRAGRRHHDRAVGTRDLGGRAGDAQHGGNGAAGEGAGVGVAADDDVAGHLDGHGAAVDEERDGRGGPGVNGGEAQDRGLSVRLGAQAGQALGAHRLGGGGRLGCHLGFGLGRGLLLSLGRGRGAGLAEASRALGGLGGVNRRLFRVGDDVKFARGLLGVPLGGLLNRLGRLVLGGLRLLLGRLVPGGGRGASGGGQGHGAVAGGREELGLDGRQVDGGGVQRRLGQLLAGLAAGAALVVRYIGVDEEAHRVDGHGGQGLDLVQGATDANLGGLDAVGGGNHPRDLVTFDDGRLEGLPLAGVEGPGPDRVGPHLLGDLAGGAHAQLNVTEDRQVGLFARAVEQQDVAPLGLHVGEPRLRVRSAPHDVGGGVREVQRNQRRTERAGDEHRALSAAQEASNLKHQLLPSLRGTRRAVWIDAGRTG